MPKKYALIGAAGYIAPRHMKAIKDTGGELIAALDPHDSVGVLDSYFPNCQFFTEFERFERFLDPYHNMTISHGDSPGWRIGDCPIDYLVVCSPNYLHDAHIRFGLRIGASVICEKPLVINPHNLTPLLELEEKSVGNIYPILQCRLHPDVQELKDLHNRYTGHDPFQIAITYNTPRGPWYSQSWKGDERKSGGLIMNIGVHLLDLMCWVFGGYESQRIMQHSSSNIIGQINFRGAEVYYSLGIRSKHNIPYKRRIDVNLGEFIIDLTRGFQDLHTQAYRNILDGNGFEVTSVAPAIQLASDIRRSLV